MNDLPEQLTFEMVMSLIICLCVFSIFLAVIIDFGLYSRHEGVHREKKSVVDTATMTLFFLFFYALLQSRKGLVHIAPGLGKVLMISGVLMVVTGCFINIKGRWNLGNNWANHIKIYQEHRLVETGMYGVVRHPLYASIILMFYGACLVYHNILALAAVTAIFVPFMVYRAKQEEALLIEEFPQYANYQRRTGMLFPQILRKKDLV